MKKILEREMESKDLTQTELAKSIGISQAALHNILNDVGDRKVATVQKVARYFCLRPSYFIDGEAHDIGDLKGLTDAEYDILMRYRYLCERGHGKDAINFIMYLSDKEGYTPPAVIDSNKRSK